MLFKLEPKTGEIKIVERVRLLDFGWDERKFQDLLFVNLDRVIQEEEFLVIMQSRQGQEEPDLIALDEKGDLWIFELKAWESEKANVLQVLRYGQKFGQYQYDELNELYAHFRESEESLLKVHANRFPEAELIEEHFNRNQHFVVLTNGLDFQTRQAVIFWCNKKLDIRPWIYRIYRTEGKDFYLEFNTFRKTDNPFEDIEEGFFIVNTNIANSEKDDEDMLKNRKAAAYFTPWKYKIKKISPSDRVFLYRSGEGIIAGGISKGPFKRKDYHDNPDHQNEEYFVDLRNFHQAINPIAPSEIHEITGISYRFMQTLFAIDKDSGEKLWNELIQRSKK